MLGNTFKKYLKAKGESYKKSFTISRAAFPKSTPANSAIKLCKDV